MMHDDDGDGDRDRDRRDEDAKMRGGGDKGEIDLSLSAVYRRRGCGRGMLLQQLVFLLVHAGNEAMRGQVRVIPNLSLSLSFFYHTHTHTHTNIQTHTYSSDIYIYGVGSRVVTRAVGSRAHEATRKRRIPQRLLRKLYR